jgi:hypothetical protein
MSLRGLELRQRIGKLRTTDGSVNFPQNQWLFPLACTGDRFYDEASGWIVAIAREWTVIQLVSCLNLAPSGAIQARVMPRGV